MKKLFKQMKGYEWFENVTLSRSKDLIMFNYHDRTYCLYQLGDTCQLVDFEATEIVIMRYNKPEVDMYELIVDLLHQKKNDILYYDIKGAA
jgi:hypothetical protein